MKAKKTTTRGEVSNQRRRKDKESENNIDQLHKTKHLNNKNN
jgi:hypothetical protein